MKTKTKFQFNMRKGMHGVGALPTDSPQIQQSHQQQPQQKPIQSPNNYVLPPKPAHLAAQTSAPGSFRQKKPPMPSPTSLRKVDQEVREFIRLVIIRLTKSPYINTNIILYTYS